MYKPDEDERELLERRMDIEDRDRDEANAAREDEEDMLTTKPAPKVEELRAGITRITTETGIEYQTPDGQKFDTFASAVQHVAELRFP